MLQVKVGFQLEIYSICYRYLKGGSFETGDHSQQNDINCFDQSAFPPQPHYYIREGSCVTCLMYDVEDSNLGGETSSYLNSYLYCLRREIEEPQWRWKA